VAAAAQDAQLHQGSGQPLAAPVPSSRTRMALACRTAGRRRHARDDEGAQMSWSWRK